jgi:transposase
MARGRRSYTEAFKREALQLWANSERTGKEIEKELGIGAGCLYRWRKESREEEESMSNENQELHQAQQRIQELELEVQTLSRERDILKQEREILKKAVTIFSRPSPSDFSLSKITEESSR